MSNKQNFIIKHASSDVLGTLPRLFDDLNIKAQVIDITQQALPAVEDIERLWVMGSVESAYDHRVPWLAKELAWLKAVQAKQVPTFGICFGSQILSRALGGEVYRNSEVEHGWVDVRVATADWPHAGPWFSFHFDAFSIPPNATALGDTSLANHAFSQGQAWGVQFHPEIDEAMFDTWVQAWESTAEGRHFMASLGELPQQLRQQIVQHSEQNYRNFKAMTEQFLRETSS